MNKCTYVLKASLIFAIQMPIDIHFCSFYCKYTYSTERFSSYPSEILQVHLINVHFISWPMALHYENTNQMYFMPVPATSFETVPQISIILTRSLLTVHRTNTFAKP